VSFAGAKVMEISKNRKKVLREKDLTLGYFEKSPYFCSPIT